jgi:hypothetical protein
VTHTEILKGLVYGSLVGVAIGLMAVGITEQRKRSA